MFSKSLTFITLLLCAIIAQTVEAKPPKKDAADSEDEADSGDEDSLDAVGEDANGKDADDDDSDDDDDEDDESDSAFVSLSCIIFKDLGCNSECKVIGKAFGLSSEGSCTKENICECDTKRDVSSLDTMWKEVFDSPSVLKEIKQDKKLSKQVRQVFDGPSLLTGQEIKQDLKSILSDDQYKKLKLQDSSEAAKMIKKDGQLDQAAIKKHVASQLPKILKSSDDKKLTSLKYKPTLQKALKTANDESETAFTNLALDIRRTKNKSLGDILDEYMKKNKIDKPVKDKETPTVGDAIAYYIVDELLGKVDDEKDTKAKKPSAKKPSTKKPKSSSKKPVAKKSGKKSKDEDDEEDDDDEEASSGTNRFHLRGFNKDAIRRSSGPMNQNWSKHGWTVHYQREWSSYTSVDWTKGSDEVSIQKEPSSAVTQNWKFGKVRINITKQPSGAISETWNLVKSTYKYSRQPSGQVYSDWKGKTDKKTLAEYRKLIDAWCAENSFLISMSYCVIYETRY